MTINTQTIAGEQVMKKTTAGRTLHQELDSLGLYAKTEGKKGRNYRKFILRKFTHEIIFCGDSQQVWDWVKTYKMSNL